jgi:hypothetical protein
MKKLYALLVVIVLVSTTQAQSFAPIGAVWHYSEFYSSSGDTGFFKVKVAGDSVISGKTYSVLESEFSCLPSELQLVRASNDSVFIYLPHLSDERAIYNLNDVGSTFFYETDNDGTYFTTTIDSIGTYMVNGQAMAATYVTYSYVNTNSLTQGAYQSIVLDLFGDVSYMFNFFSAAGTCDLNYPRGLRCYEDNTNGTFHFDGMPECEHIGEYVGVEDVMELSSFSVYPNPSDGLVQINNLTVGNRMTLIDARGSVVLEWRANETAMELNLEDFDNGIYLLQVENYLPQKLIVR